MGAVVSESEEDIERVAIVLADDPWGEGRTVHTWKRTMDLPWLAMAHCTGCGCLSTATRHGLTYTERTPTGMAHRTTEPKACMRLAASVDLRGALS